MSTSTTSTTTLATAPSASTSTTPVAEAARTLDEFVPPTEAIDSFSFEFSMLDRDAEPFGLVSVGEFVAPDAVTCDAWNPALGGKLGTGTAIESSFWFDDGFFDATESARTDPTAAEWLAFCPGAEEFWDSPPFLDPRVSARHEGDGEVIFGYDTQVYVLEGSDDFEIREGSVWLTDEGWPIRVSIEGTIPGGVFSLLDREGELADEGALSDAAIPISIELHLTGFNGAQVVRSPDGSRTVGPVGEPVATVALPGPLVGPLSEAADRARDSACYESWTLEFLIDGEDLEALELSAIHTSIVDGNLTQTVPGMASGGFGSKVTTTAEGDNRYLHADLLFNHIAPLIAYLDWTGDQVPELMTDGKIHVSISDQTGSESTDIASWDGYTIAYDDGSQESRSYHTYLALPDPSLAVTGTALDEANARIAEWWGQMLDIATPLASGDLQAAVNLEQLATDLDTLRAVACVLLGSAYAASEAAFGTSEDANSHLLAELAVQQTLLATEYVALLAAYLDTPRIDWLRGDGIDLSTGLLAGDTTGTVVRFLADMLAASIEIAVTASEF